MKFVSTGFSPLFQRVLLLFACVAAGLLVGFVGRHIMADAAWFLAVPVCVALGWIFVANPEECVACVDSSRQGAQREQAAHGSERQVSE